MSLGVTSIGLWALLFASCLLCCRAAGAAQGTRGVVLFVGDGMGVSTVTAARILDGQNRGEPGEENYLAFERFPNVALVKTYNVDAQVPDSAGTMTALVTGHKARAGVLSIDPSVARGDCAAAAGKALPTLLEEAEQRGFKTGLVSTARITHATPAAAYAHAADRNWEYAATMRAEVRGKCKDIARQLVEFPYGDGVDVVLGGGRGVFLPVERADPEDENTTGHRRDERDLVTEWLAAGQAAGLPRRFVFDRAGFDELAAGGLAGNAQVLGLFEVSHMEHEADRAADAGGEPSLAEMTAFALDRLASSPGFLLIVEGGRIDHAHHAGNAYRALSDTIAFAAAVAVAVERTDPAETLILVTADHSHTLTIAGYPARGNPILGYAVGADGKPQKDLRGEAYTTLGYANGPGGIAKARGDSAPADRDYRQRATHPLMAETHAGEDVPAYARGRGAQRVRGVMDQHELHGVMRTALFDGLNVATRQTRQEVEQEVKQAAEAQR